MFTRKGIVKTPTIQQMERTECGAVCLGIILGYFGRWETLEILRIACGVSRDGSRAGNVVRAARRYGLVADGYKIDIDAIREVKTPFVVFWSFDHFIVVEGVGRSKVWINDPAVGRRSIAWSEFDRNYTGIALLFSKGHDFLPGGEAPSLRRSLLRRIRESKTAIGFIALLSLTMVVPGILVPNFSKLFVDYYLVKRFDDWLQPLLIAMAAAALLQGCLTWLQQKYLLRLETRFSVMSSSAFIRQLVRLPIPFFSQRSASELAARATQTESLAQLVTGSMGTALLSLPSIVIFAVVMLSFDIYLGLLGVAFAAVNIGTLVALSRNLAERNQAVMMQQTKITGAAASGLRMISEYKASGSENLLFQRIVGLKARQENLNATLQQVRLALQAVPIGVVGIATAALLTVGGLRVISGDITVGVLVAFQALLVSFLGPVNQLVGMGQQVQNAQAYVTQIDDLMHQPVSSEFDALVSAKDGRGAQRSVGHIALREVSFGYSPLDPPLVRDISLDVAPGEWIAVVGRSGSGKSTFARLLAGLEKPWNGEILIDDKVLSAIPPAMLRNSVAVVDQNAVIFEGSIRDNISMWDPTMTEEAVIAAAKIAEVHDFIISRPQAYDVKLTEDGGNLSGGQRALLDLARAIATHPSILILDEATAALDAVTEEKVMSNLRQLGCTCITIAHRLSTVRDADRILVFDNGSIVESGSHEQLLAQCGLYKSLLVTE
jgi:NHLM bacteriocin system ABC transporter peptidase/ATP-binding protein